MARLDLKGLRFRAAQMRKPQWWANSYFADWALLCIVFFIVVFVGNVPSSPRIRFFTAGDPTLSYPFATLETVPPALLVVIVIIVPIVVFGAWQFWMQSGHDFHHAMLGLLTSVVFTQLVTDSIKMTTGVLRPDFLSRLDGGNPSVITEGRKSFPSGHSSLSFASMMFVSLYISGKLSVFLKCNGGAPLWKVVVAMAPLAIAFLTAASRVIDYRHSTADVTFGSCLGAAMAMYCYGLVYPSLSSPDASVPLSRADAFVRRYRAEQARWYSPEAVAAPTAPALAPSSTANYERTSLEDGRADAV